ncbi:MAG: hypothetical protein AB7O50_01400 [Pseudolabrys sp.]
MTGFFRVFVRGLFRNLTVLGVAMALLAQAAVTVHAASWLEKKVWMSGPRYDAVLPQCEAALSTIAERFATKEGRFWNSDLQILDFERVRQIAFMPWREGTVPRRYCAALAAVSDGRKRSVYYSIIEDGGIIGASWGVEWCVVGLDRNWAYNPACRMARP